MPRLIIEGGRLFSYVLPAEKAVQSLAAERREEVQRVDPTSASTNARGGNTLRSDNRQEWRSAKKTRR